jgi:hypothetical protein
MSNTPPVDLNLEFLTVLGLTQPVTVDDVKQAYLEKAKSAHPDRGGDVKQFVRLQKAFEQATEYAQFKAGRMQWLTRWVEQYAEQEQLVKELKALGGSVTVNAADVLTSSIGQDFATVLERIQGIHLSGKRIDDSVLLHLGMQRRILAGLKRLELIETSVTSIGLQQLHDLDNLEHLDLSGTQVGFHALENLVRELPRIETLGLRNSGINLWSRMKLRFVRHDLVITA